jgi:hypothetical protein
MLGGSRRRRALPAHGTFGLLPDRVAEAVADVDDASYAATVSRNPHINHQRGSE